MMLTQKEQIQELSTFFQFLTKFGELLVFVRIMKTENHQKPSSTMSARGPMISISFHRLRKHALKFWSSSDARKYKISFF